MFNFCSISVKSYRLPNADLGRSNVPPYVITVQDQVHDPYSSRSQKRLRSSSSQSVDYPARTLFCLSPVVARRRRVSLRTIAVEFLRQQSGMSGRSDVITWQAANAALDAVNRVRQLSINQAINQL